MPLLRVSHQATLQVLARAAVILRFDWDRNASQFTRWLLESDTIFLPHGLLHRINYCVAADFLHREQEGVLRTAV